MDPAPCRSALSSLLLLLAVGAVSCQELPKQRGRQVAVLVEGDLERLNPADVVVAPLELAEEGMVVPQLTLRRAIQEALVRRHYSPLGLDFVDSRVIEANYTMGSLGEEAVCLLVVHDWDERYWETGRILEVDLEMRLLDPALGSGPPLWAARFEGRVDVTGEQGRMTEPALYRYAVDEVARELASRLPVRQTVPGRD